MKGLSLQVSVLASVLLLSSSLGAAVSDICDDEKRAAGTAGCAALGPRHDASEPGTTATTQISAPFDSYVQGMRQRIGTVRQDLTAWPGIDVVDVNAPFELVPDPVRCGAEPKGSALLVHGLTDSPYLMRDIGARLQARCLLVRAIVLPGHGTVPGDLLEVQYEAWLSAVSAGIRGLGAIEGPLVVVGFSTGAAAALHTQLDDDASDVADALVLVSPAVKPKSQWAFMANWHKLRGFFKSPEEYAPHRWLEVAADHDYAKYESFPKNAGDQIHELSAAVGKLGCENLNTPIFMVLSEDDNTVSADAAKMCFEKAPIAKRRLLLYVKKNAGSEKSDSVIVRAIQDVENRVLDFSHTALPVAPNNPHYGETGDYRNCMHYIGNVAKWDACKNGDDVMRGENSEDNVETQILQRLTFNPDFDGMMGDIDGFLEGVTRIRPRP